MTENTLLKQLLANHAQAREINPNLRPLSEAEIIVLAAITYALEKGSANLAQYGAIDIATITAGLAGLVALSTEAGWAITDKAVADTTKKN